MSSITFTIDDIAQGLGQTAKRDEAAWDEVGNFEQQASALASTAEQAGRVRVRTLTRYCIDNGVDEAGLMGAWLDLLLRGADDGWSGRRNDVRRSYFDGVRDEIDRLRRGW